MSFYPHRTEKRTNEVSTGYKNRRSQLLPAALSYARRGVPVFPIKPGGKRPLTRRGHLDATTDPEKIRRWWSRWPEANLGIPTGEKTGLLVLDVDRPEALDVLEADHRELPATRTHGTGSGGKHLLYRYPDTGEEFRNSAGKLAHGLDIRGEGGYIVAPPSRTTGPYEVLDRLPLAEPPEWLLEALRRPRDAAREVGSPHASAPIAHASAPIPEGRRDNTLASIAGRMHDGTRDLNGLIGDLLEVNENRCLPPLLDTQVVKIARSVHARTPCKRSTRATPEVLEALDAIEADIMRREWSGMGGKSERDAAIAALRLARMHGTMIPTGVRVSVDVRTWALMSSVSKRAMLDNKKKGERVPGIVSRLKARGVIRSDNANRHGKEAGAVVLLHPAQDTRARLHHSTTDSSLSTTELPCGATLRGPLTAPRLRWSRPVFDGPERVGTISRLNKSKGEIIDHLEAAGGTLVVEDLADALSGEDGKRPRVRDLRRRHLEPLEATGVVECSGDAVSLTADWLHALNVRRDLDGEIDDHCRDMARYEREREAYRNRDARPADPAPTVEEMRECRESHSERRRRGIEAAVAMLFADRPEYRGRRVGQIVCQLHDYLPDDFPRGPIGHPKDHEVEAILDGEDVAA